jgi:hypothetical protein
VIKEKQTKKGYEISMRRHSYHHKPFLDLFKSEGLEQRDVLGWCEARGIKYQISIACDYFTFADYDAWVQFRLAWL